MKSTPAGAGGRAVDNIRSWKTLSLGERKMLSLLVLIVIPVLAIYLAFRVARLVVRVAIIAGAAAAVYFFVLPRIQHLFPGLQDLF